MPNHITNKVTLTGSNEDIKSLLLRFGKQVPETQMTSYDGYKTYKNKDGVFGWHNEETNVFSRRNEDDFIGIPKGYYPAMNSAYFNFPDFNRIKKMPEILEGLQPHLGIIDAVIAKFQHPISGNLVRMKEHNFNNEDQIIFEKCCAAYEETGFAYWRDWSIRNWGTKWNSYSHEKISDNEYSFQTAWSGVPNLIKLMSLEFPKVSILYEYADEDTGCNVGEYLFLNGDDFKESKIENMSKEAYELAFKLNPGSKVYYKLVNGKYEYIEDEI